MNDAVGMCGLECVGNLRSGLHELRRVEALARQPLRERLAFQQLDGDEVIAFMLLDRIDGADVRMIERRGGARLTLESLERLRIAREFLRKKLDGHATSEPAVFGFIDDAHAALTQ